MMDQLPAAPRTHVPAPYELARMTNEQLREQIGRAIAMTAESIAYLAAVWVELEKRGEDMSGLRISLAPFLRDVAAGRLAPEAVLSFAGQKMVLRWVARQPVPEQLSLAAGHPVTIRDRDGTIRRVTATDLSTMDLRLIEASDEAGAEAKPFRAATAAVATKPYRSAARTVVVPVSVTEHQQVLRAARENGMSVANYVRSKINLELRQTRGQRP